MKDKSQQRLPPKIVTPVVVVQLCCLAGWSNLLAQQPGVLNATYRFHLIHGKGVPVCEAFLKRLEVAKFSNPPYCGIPESASVPGFSVLHRLSLTEKEVVDLAPRVAQFTYTQEQDIAPYPYAVEDVREGFKIHNLFVWRYDPQITVNNDGHSDRVVVWQGPGLYWDLADERCGDVFRANAPSDGYRTPQIALVIAPNGRKIDEAATKRLLGLSEARSIYRTSPYASAPEEFIPLGFSLGFFEYRGIYYMHTFGKTIPWKDNPIIA